MLASSLMPPPVRYALGLGLALALASCSKGGVTSGPVQAISCQAGSWPTADTVGIPAGTPALTVLEGDQHTERGGQVFDAVEFRGRLYVDHPGVVIRRSRLIGDEYYAIYSTIDDGHLTIEDSEILGGVLLTDHFVGRRNHLHAPAGGTRDDGWIFAASHVLLEDNLIDGLVGGNGAHLDGIQVMSGDDITIRHNWIAAVSPRIDGGGVNAAVFFGPDFGEISNVTVDCNMLIEEDGYYPLRLDARGSVVVRRNRWQRGHLGSPALATDTTITVWEDNAYVDGEVIASP